MTFASTFNTANADSLMGRLATTLRTARARHKAYVRTRDELHAMSSRELADIGINRSMIPAVAREAAALAG
ncbi:Uncharacterized conserved protein YjiS, DUF1127 family [Loktanella sp. DSM 29012]|uniref:DUF1127 domain-containing protein n=1 Tax=Loktanella gaetbuli TaxID=2881335 RepID=A0ABS8BXY8_9RHOB|nr:MULTISPECIES: DUF1127 domain-containing protein [Loktanella]MCB5200559.1 DUF1127 domain-containing protein [Loktanella gaetbuli]SEQ36652.1 Uncharacterized conserved protein YjiS, DUF1127 family [Loktanella sp. DSM 29012]